MPITEIIIEIDAYLSLLRRARELLLPERTEAPEKRAPGRQRKAMVQRSGQASSTRRRGEENKSPSNHPAAHLKTVGQGAATNSQVASAAADHPSSSERAKITEPKRVIQESIPITRLPARRRTSPVRSRTQRIAKPSSSTRPVAMRPAIALAGAMNAKVVVVSAEQAQKEREQAARPAVPRVRPPRSGLTGRLAFEALFEDGTKPAKTSGQ